MGASKKSRKHRVVVEITVSKPISDTDAVTALHRVMDRIDLRERPIWDFLGSPYCEKLQSKSFGRVVREYNKTEGENT